MIVLFSSRVMIVSFQGLPGLRGEKGDKGDSVRVPLSSFLEESLSNCALCLHLHLSLASSTYFLD